MPDSSDEILRASELAAEELVTASATAFTTFRSTIDSVDTTRWADHHRKLVDMVDQAEATSRAIELLRKNGLVLQALALLRVRVEQTIVCSYLLHEDSDEVFRRYFSFPSIGEFRQALELLKDAFLAEHLRGQVELDRLREAAVRVETSFNPNFDITKGKLRSKWTALDLGSMAMRRDKLCTSSCKTREFVITQIGTIPPAMLIPLASLYASVYKTASAIIHADASAIASPFVGEIKGKDGKLRPASLFWTLMIPLFWSPAINCNAWK